jgi:hypothetical protein
MRPPRRPSRKRSAASSSAKPPEAAVFYLDESILSNALAGALEQAGVQVRRPGVHVPFGASDATWLKVCGEQGWVVLMRDQRVRYRQLELDALRAARVAAFVFTGGQTSAREVARVIVRKLLYSPARLPTPALKAETFRLAVTVLASDRAAPGGGMAISVRIECINKADRFNPHKHITHIGGRNADGTPWKLTEEEAIQGVHNGKWSFYVHRAARTVSVIVARSREGREYLKTEDDGYIPDNLLSLPECP